MLQNQAQILLSEHYNPLQYQSTNFSNVCLQVFVPLRSWDVASYRIYKYDA